MLERALDDLGAGTCSKLETKGIDAPAPTHLETKEILE
jgi:hypothetical protein